MKTLIIWLCMLCSMGFSCDRKPIEVLYNGKDKNEWSYIAQDSSRSSQEHIEAMQSLCHFQVEGVANVKGTGWGVQQIILSLSKDKDIQVRLVSCESYLTAGGPAKDILPAMDSVIVDKDAWIYSPRIVVLISKMGTSAAPLKTTLLKKQDESPNSQNRRWQDCIDAIRE